MGGGFRQPNISATYRFEMQEMSAAMTYLSTSAWFTLSIKEFLVRLENMMGRQNSYSQGRGFSDRYSDNQTYQATYRFEMQKMSAVIRNFYTRMTCLSTSAWFTLSITEFWVRFEMMGR